MSSNQLVPSFRYVDAIPHGAAHETVVQALRDHTDGITDLQIAWPILVGRVSALEAKSSTSSSSSSSSSSSGGSTTTGVTSFNAQTGAIQFFPALGNTDDQTGQTSYSLQSQDNGALLVLNDASAISVVLNASLVNPFICIVMNMGTGTATFSATSPQVINSFHGLAASSITLLPGYLCVISLNGNVWNFATLPIVPVNTPAVSHEWLASYNSSTGAFTQTQPSFSDVSGTLQAGQLLTGTTGSLGGSPMTAGQTITIAVSITGATTSMVAVCSPVTSPGAGFVWNAYVSSADTVTVALTCVAAGTPTASAYNCRVLQ